MAERLGIMDARSLSASDMTPCNTCDLKPATCDQQRVVKRDDGLIILCRLGRGFVERLPFQNMRSESGGFSLENLAQFALSSAERLQDLER